MTTRSRVRLGRDPAGRYVVVPVARPPDPHLQRAAALVDALAPGEALTVPDLATALAVSLIVADDLARDTASRGLARYEQPVPGRPGQLRRITDP